MTQEKELSGLCGKFKIEGLLRLKTGLHIGGGDNFSFIGAVDSVVVRNPSNGEPYLPGSSLKGKMRYLLARVYSSSGKLFAIEDENDILKRLFGSSKPEIVISRLQFFDCFLEEESKKLLDKLNLDFHYTEVKSENTINRATAVANPRQIERVPEGACFKTELIYNVENPEEIKEDFWHLGCGFALLENDYLGGSGTRGYGRVAFENFQLQYINYASLIKKETAIDTSSWEEIARNAFEKGRKGIAANSEAQKR